ncbi:hypothetical protein P3T27_000831 [Kitasatospora sp. MAA19]|nr:hypothetical protein [Kitasatospora sp. MAA19]
MRCQHAHRIHKLPADIPVGDVRWKEHRVVEPTKPATRGDLLIAVEELVAVQDRYDSLRSDNAGSSGDAPWPGGDGNLHDTE